MTAPTSRSGLRPMSHTSAPAGTAGTAATLSSYDVWMARTGQLPHGWVLGEVDGTAGRYLPAACGMNSLSRIRARLSALRAAPGVGRPSMAARCW